MDHPFRSAAFGGFNRQDVLDYLEKTAAENARKKQELQQRLEEAEEDRRKLASQESDQEERVTILNRDRESLSQQLEQVKAVLEASREREEAQSRELEELRRERDSLRRRVAELEPGAAAYTAVKERAAGVELEAHCRAQNVLNEADGSCAGAWSSGWAGSRWSTTPCAARWSPPSPTRRISWRRRGSVWSR